MILWLGTVIKESVEEIVEQGKEAESVSTILVMLRLFTLLNYFIEWTISANINLKISHFSGYGGKHYCGRLQLRLAQIDRKIRRRGGNL